MFIETSKDLLYVVLAFCALWLTVFISWFLYYVISLLRDLDAVSRQVKGVAEKADQLMYMLHDKMERGAATFNLIANTVKELVVWGIQERNKTRGGSTSTKTGRKMARDDEE
jgi:hypothetical protein